MVISKFARSVTGLRAGLKDGKINSGRLIQAAETALEATGSAAGAPIGGPLQYYKMLKQTVRGGAPETDYQASRRIRSMIEDSAKRLNRTPSAEMLRLRAQIVYKQAQREGLEPRGKDMPSSFLSRYKATHKRINNP
jgi:hypothetical protein